MQNLQVAIADQLPIAEIINIGNAFAASGMFQDIKGAAQAIVKIQAGQEIGIPPFAAMTGIHIIAGKPSIGAGIMASRVKGSGKYDYKVIRHDKDNCTIEFFQAEKSLGKSEFTIQDAQKAGTKNLDKFPKNMLFARAMSNGVRFFCPDIFSGPVYVPEEFDASDVKVEDVQPVDVSTGMVAEGSASTGAAVVVQPEELTQSHPNWPAVTDALLNKGYSVDQVKSKYSISPEIEGVLSAIVLARPPKQTPAAPQPVTQQQIHQANSTYVPPASAPAGAVARPKPF